MQASIASQLAGALQSLLMLLGSADSLKNETESETESETKNETKNENMRHDALAALLSLATSASDLQSWLTTVVLPCFIFISIPHHFLTHFIAQEKQIFFKSLSSHRGCLLIESERVRRLSLPWPTPLPPASRR